MSREGAAFWDQMAPRYAGMRLADPAAWEATLERVRDHLRPGDRVLELGCGTGPTAIRLAPSVREYVATDISPAMIAIARARPEAQGLKMLRFRVAEATATGDGSVDDPVDDPADGPLDAVLAFNLLHLLPDLPAALAAIRARLRPGGLFLSKTPCIAELSPFLRLAIPPLWLLGLAPRFRSLHRATLEGAIAAAGFEIVETADLPARRAQRFVVARRA